MRGGEEIQFMPEYKGYGYKRNWKKWAIIYILAAIIIYAIIYLIFFGY